MTAVDEEGSTGLIVALRANRDEKDKVPLIKLLLNRGFAPRCADDLSWNALHWACYLSSSEIVELLLDADPALVDLPVPALDEDGAEWSGSTPLDFCCHRWDNDAAKVANVLLDRGATVNKRGAKPFLNAVLHSRPEMVSLLLSNGAELHQKTKGDGNTALHLACQNGAFGADIIPFLAGIDPLRENALHETAFSLAAGHSGAMMEAVERIAPQGLKVQSMKSVKRSNTDPLGRLYVASKYVKPFSSSSFSNCVGIVD